MKSEENGNGRRVGMGIAIGTAALAALGAYYLYGTKSGAKQRQKMRGWMLKIKGEVLQQLESLKEVNETAYNDIVDTVYAKYSKLKNIDPSELKMIVEDVRKHWGTIKKYIDTMRDGNTSTIRDITSKKRPVRSRAKINKETKA